MKKGMALLAALAVALGVSTAAQARDSGFNGNSYGGYTYDRSSGNSYYRNGAGTVRGGNTVKGSRWSSTTNGSFTHGTDSKGNAWSYNRDSGSYYNYGTGESRSRGRPR